MPRKKPFSGKAKKKQLQEKRERKRNATASSENIKKDTQKDKQLPTRSGKKDLRTIFEPEPREVILERKKDASRFLEYKHKVSPYIDGLGQPCNELSMPTRPPWTHEMTPEELDAQEEETFQSWLTNIKNNYTLSQLNYFEQNIQVWKQLWRVIEKSDILLLLIDARFPIIHFNTTLYDHVKNGHGKDMILCITKIDLISKERLEKWKWFYERYFKELVVCTLSQEQSTEDIRNRLFDAIASCKVTKNGVSKSASTFLNTKSIQTTTEEDHEAKIDREKHITVGITGDPNMGKSTIINRLFDKKVVSESSTPGHTKHFQTMFLLPTLCICDCPGVVFPKLNIGREVQILFGLYPISQVREPYSAIRYLAEHIIPPLHEIYKLVPIDDYGDDIKDAYENANYKWSPYRIIEAFAKKKQFYIRGGRFDMYRAANFILRDALRGSKVVLSFDPPTSEEYENFVPQLSNPMNGGEKQCDIIVEEVDDESDEYSGNSGSSDGERNVERNFQLLQIDDEDESDDEDTN